MDVFFYIVINIMLPIFLLAGVGFVVQKKFRLDTRTFSRLNIYVFVPALIFTKVYEAEITIGLLATVFIYVMAVQAFLFIIGEGIARLLKYPRSKKKCFINSLIFFNSGNYGLPLTDLVYKGDPLAYMGQVFIVLIQNVMTSSFGVFQASSGSSGYKKALRDVIKMPFIYVIAAVVLVKTLNIELPQPVMIPLNYISDAFIAFALITLGVQLAEIRVGFNLRDMSVASVLRLMVSPLIGYVIVSMLGIQGILAQSLILGVATPTAVNTAIIAREFDNEPDYASQNVFISTVLSPITVSIIIYLFNGNI